MSAAGPLQRLLEGAAPGFPFEAVVEGASMGAALPDRSRVKVEPVTGEELQIGDIILHKAVDGRLVAHRVVGTGTARNGSVFFVTQGDQQTFCDMPVTATEVLGRVAAIWNDGGWRAPDSHSSPRQGWSALASRACLSLVMVWARLSTPKSRRAASRGVMRLRS